MFFFKIFNNNYINEVNNNNHAILIQSIWRMYIVKKNYKCKKNAALKIQNFYKRYKFRVRRKFFKNKLNELIIVENNININNSNNKLHNKINNTVDNIINDIIDNTIEKYNESVTINELNKINYNYNKSFNNLKNRKVGFSNKIDYINKNYNSILEEEDFSINNILNNKIDTKINTKIGNKIENTINLNDVIIDVNDYRKDYNNYLCDNYNYDYIKKYEKYDNDLNCLSIMKNAVKNISSNLVILKDCFKFDVENHNENLKRQYYGNKYNYKYGTFTNDYELEYLNKV